MANVMIMVICIANDYLPHDELCKIVTFDKPYLEMRECLAEGKFVVDKLADQGYYPSVYCGRTSIEMFNRKDEA